MQHWSFLVSWGWCGLAVGPGGWAHQWDLSVPSHTLPRGGSEPQCWVWLSPGESVCRAVHLGLSGCTCVDDVPVSGKVAEITWL